MLLSNLKWHLRNIHFRDQVITEKPQEVPDAPKSRYNHAYINTEQKVEQIQNTEPIQTQSESFTTNSTNTSLDFNSDLMNMIITENRLQNTELRMAMMKMSEKVDKLLENQNTNRSNREK